MRFYLTGHNNFGNRGCEALVRSTVHLLRQRFPGASFMVPSVHVELDRRQWPDCAASGIEFVGLPPMPAGYIHRERLVRRLPMLLRMKWPALEPDAAVRAQLSACDAVLSVGGDNISLDYGLASLFYFTGIADAALALGRPAALWGASVGPFDRLPAVEHRMAEHLRRLSLITPRESHTETYLRGIGVTDNVVLVTDPAFVMAPEPVDTSSFWPDHGVQGVLGFNVSPLIEARRGGSSVRHEAAAFIEEATSAGWGVLLVPHVAPLDGARVNNDETYLGELLQLTGSREGRVRAVPSGLNAPQLKHVISRCRCFIGARTHATIAALSTGVPTLSIAYSVKARGINRDLFGDERYVLETPQLAASTLRRGLDRLVADEGDIRSLLVERIPEWRQRAAAGVEALARLLQPAGEEVLP